VPTPDLTEQQQQLLNVVQSAHAAADKVHSQHRPLWEERWKLYRTYQDFKSYMGAEPDRDTRSRVNELVSEWGSDLRLPWAFATVETIVARSLTNRPRMLYVPWDRAAMAVGSSGRPNTENMRLTIDAQQDQIRYPMSCQTTAKTGQILGIGVRKTMWREERRQTLGLVKASGNNGFEWTTEPRTRGFSDPDSQDVDPFNFFWDPSADSIDDCEFVVHRTWRSVGYVMGKIREAEAFLAQQPNAMQEMPDEVPGWPLAIGMTEEDVRALGAGDRWTEVWGGRDAASGVKRSSDTVSRLEVWEYHDGNRCIVVLGRQVPVRVVNNAMWHGELPFHIYRPSEVPHEFVGIGAIEPSKYLFYEMDLLRSQRRDVATLALSPVFAYRDGTIDPAHLQVYPGATLPTLGEPMDVLRKIDLGDVPSSGYAEEDRIKADIERATGLGDVVIGASTTGGGTATEAQLQLASANVRIQNMTYRFEQEVIADECQQFVLLNQQHIREARGYAVMEPAPGQPDHRWTWFDVGPDELAGEMHARCLGGSEANNVPQMRSDAQSLMALVGNPNVDQRKLMATILQKTGIDFPEAMLAEQNRVPPQTMDSLMQIMAAPAEQGGLGMDPALAKQVLDSGLQMGVQAEQAQVQQGGAPGPAAAAQPTAA
jgi:hypothetical protein